MAIRSPPTRSTWDPNSRFTRRSTEPTKALIRAEERTDTKADTMGSPAEEAKARGTEITVAMTPPRMDTMRIAPNRDHRWPRLIRQLLERPPTAFAFSIMIAGA